MTEQSKNDLIALINDALTGKCLTMGKDCIKKEDVAIWIADEFEKRKLYFNITPMEPILYSADTSIGIKVINPMPVPATDHNQYNLLDQIKEVEGMDFDRDDARKGKSTTIINKPTLKIKLTTPMPITNDAMEMGKWKNFIPEYAKTNDACFDCRADVKSMDGLDVIYLQPGFRVLIPLGFKAELPDGYKATLHMRSGLAIKQGLMMVNGRGTIDNGYRGIWGAIVYNSGKETITINHGDRICQGELERYEQCGFQLVDELTETDRGEGGYGHSGKS